MLLQTNRKVSPLIAQRLQEIKAKKQTFIIEVFAYFRTDEAKALPAPVRTDLVGAFEKMNYKQTYYRELYERAATPKQRLAAYVAFMALPTAEQFLQAHFNK